MIFLGPGSSIVGDIYHPGIMFSLGLLVNCEFVGEKNCDHNDHVNH